MKFSHILLALTSVGAEQILAEEDPLQENLAEMEQLGGDDSVLLKDVQVVPEPDLKLDNSVTLKEEAEAKEAEPEVPVKDAENALVNSFGYCVNSKNNQRNMRKYHFNGNIPFATCLARCRASPACVAIHYGYGQCGLYDRGSA